MSGVPHTGYQPPLVVTSFTSSAFLIIDGHKPSLDVTAAFLQAMSAGTILSAPDAASAANVLVDRKGNIDCLICENHLADKSGLALLQRIRTGRNAVLPRDTRFIFVTGDSDAAVVRAAAQLDAHGFLVKPATFEAFSKTLQIAFGRLPALRPAAEYAALTLPPGRCVGRSNIQPEFLPTRSR
jgi:DNA-binding NarL/FixJ family response regulator